ncbi:hypothetical protein [Klebsiella phage Kpn17]|uniref:Uncharacterized protein n=1 Tax=Klebsiella phage Kpn17 TaxID=3044025 RepID=A0AAT9V649_9CAUD|nr:hypothetical protein [Klebsiella phage Kpn17]
MVGIMVYSSLTRCSRVLVILLEVLPTDQSAE